jgi:hypothetical protein
MTGRAIKIDKRLPLFIGGRAGVIESDRSKIPSLAGLRAPRLPSGCRIYLMKAMCDSCPSRSAARLPGWSFSEDRSTQTLPAYSFWRDFQELCTTSRMTTISPCHCCSEYFVIACMTRRWIFSRVGCLRRTIKIP